VLKSDLRPLSPHRQKLSSIDPTLAAAAKIAVEVGVGAAGSLLSTWVWNRCVASRRKSKHPHKDSILADHSQLHIEVVSIEERIVKIKKIRVTKGRL
jgi:hypothetical protein